MFSAFGIKDAPSSTGSSSIGGPQDRIQEIIRLMEQGRIVEAEAKLAEQTFELSQKIPFFQRLVQKLDATMAFQHFRLPGSDRIVVDRRDQDHGKPEVPDKSQAEEVANQTAKESVKDAAKVIQSKEADAKDLKDLKDAAIKMRLQDGKLIKEKEPAYQNYFTDRVMDRGGLEQQAASERVGKLLSLFEETIIARFENGKQVAKESADGKSKFLLKSEAQWKEFFQSFMDRMVQKKMQLSEINEFLLRGLINRGNKGVVIGDLQLANGQTEKFVRFSVLAEILAKLKTLSPGDTFGKNILGDLSGEELAFLALAASRGRELAASMLPTQGKFMGGRAEEWASKELGLPVDQQLRQKAGLLKSKRGKGFGGALGGDVMEGDTPYRFIPWWHWGNLKRPGGGKNKWVTTVFYGALLILSIIGIAAATIRLLKGY